MVGNMVEHVSGSLNELKKMLKDYDHCKNDVSKRLLGETILKYASVFKPNTKNYKKRTTI